MGYVQKGLEGMEKVETNRPINDFTSDEYRASMGEELGTEDILTIIHEMTPDERSEYKDILLREVSDRESIVHYIARLDYAEI